MSDELTGQEAQIAARLIRGDLAQNAHYYTHQYVAQNLRIAEKLRKYAERQSD